MVHRYLAGTLGLLIVLMAVLAWRNHRRCGIPVVLPTVLVGLVVFQALLGMWTVTLLVKPAVVTAHLLGGISTLGLLWWLTLRQGRLWLAPLEPPLIRLRPWALLGLGLVLGQIFLGGWTSTNYAALACTDFPTCYGGQWLPPTDFHQAFVLWRGLGINYQYGVLDSDARTAIHLTHRAGALVVFLYVGSLSLLVIARSGSRVHRGVGLGMAAALLLQVGLGISNVLAHLPLAVAVAHNGGAALLLASLVTLIHILTPISVSDGTQRATVPLGLRSGGYP
jgi:cytochrome c oxidase assembly protein subunit 15